MKVKVQKTKEQLKQKLLSAAAMLLIATILMVSATYAWFTMSTAPEVSGISTQVGANGNLEMALLSTDSWDDLTLLDMGDIDESATSTASVTTSNLTWGNLVDLSDSAYGLSKITLMPSRLYIEQDGNDTSGNPQYKVNSVLLKTPVYGADGRVQSLDKTSATTGVYDSTKANFPSNSSAYGVRAIGTAANMSTYQLALNTARAQITTYQSAARTTASNALNDNGSAIASIAVKHGLNAATESYSATDIAAIRAMATGLDNALDSIESALRQVYAAYIASDADSGVTDDTYADALQTINSADTSLDTLNTTYPNADTTGKLPTYITKLKENQTKVQTSLDACDSADTAGTYTWSDISTALQPLADTAKMTVNGYNITELQGMASDMTQIATLVSGGLTVSVPTGSGLLSDIADFAGDYTAAVSVKVTYGSYTNLPVDATMRTATTQDPVYLENCLNWVKAYNMRESSGSDLITDYYGYIVDMAFRTNATESNLQLQTEAENRVYAGDTANADLQGTGSQMTFTTQAGLSLTKMIKLMKGIRIVLMDEDQVVLGIAALDMSLGQEDYTKTADLAASSSSTSESSSSSEEASSSEDDSSSSSDSSDPTSKGYAVLKKSGIATQNSDYITQAAYEALPAKSSVTFNEGSVTAKLYLYSFSMTESDSGTDDDPKYTGGITLGSKKESAAITDLTEDVPKKVSALVYLDGSYVNNSMVASNSANSITGFLNLQFSSSATLVPAENTKLRSGESSAEEVTYTSQATAGQSFNYNSVSYTVNEGYEIFSGSDSKVYFKQDDGDYTELTLENFTTVLTASS